MPGAILQSHDGGWGSSKWGHRHGAIMSEPPMSRGFVPAPFTPNPAGGQPTPPSTSGVLPPQKGNKYLHPEVPTGILTQP